MMRLAGATPAARSFSPTSCVKRRSTATRSTVAHATRAPLLSTTIGAGEQRIEGALGRLEPEGIRVEAENVREQQAPGQAAVPREWSAGRRHERDRRRARHDAVRTRRRARDGGGAEDEQCAQPQLADHRPHSATTKVVSSARASPPDFSRRSASQHRRSRAAAASAASPDAAAYACTTGTGRRRVRAICSTLCPLSRPLLDGPGHPHLAGEQREDQHGLLGGEERLERAHGQGDVAALHRAREIEDATHPALAHHGGDVLDSDRLVLRSTEQGRLPDLSEQGGPVVSHPLDEQARGLLADRQALRAGAPPQPLLEGPSLAGRQGHHGRGRHRAEQPVLLAIARSRQGLVGEQQQARAGVGAGAVLGQDLASLGRQGLAMANGDEAHGRGHGKGHGRLHDGRRGHLSPVENLAVEDGGAGIATERVGHGGQRVVEQLDVGAVQQERRRAAARPHAWRRNASKSSGGVRAAPGPLRTGRRRAPRCRGPGYSRRARWPRPAGQWCRPPPARPDSRRAPAARAARRASPRAARHGSGRRR